MASDLALAVIFGCVLWTMAYLSVKMEGESKWIKVLLFFGVIWMGAAGFPFAQLLIEQDTTIADATKLNTVIGVVYMAYLTIAFFITTYGVIMFTMDVIKKMKIKRQEKMGETEEGFI